MKPSSFFFGLALYSCFPGICKADHESRKAEIYDRYEIVSFSRTQTPEGAVLTIAEAICGKFDNLEELGKKDLSWLFDDAYGEFKKAGFNFKNEPVYFGIIQFNHFDGISKSPRWQAYIAGRKKGAKEIDYSIDRIYFFKNGEYKRFSVKLDRVDKTANVGDPGWNNLFSHVDAALQHPNGKVYFFSGAEFQRYKKDSDGDYSLDKTAKLDEKSWPGVWKDGVDAAFIHPVNGCAYFFKGKEYKRFRFGNGEHVDKTGKTGIDGFEGVWKDGIDDVVMHQNGNGYFFKGSKYRRFNFDTDKVDKEGEIDEDGWMGVWNSTDAAVDMRY